MARNFEDYVTQEQAFALKQIGFNWNCNHYYETERKHIMHRSEYMDHNRSKKGVSAPTLAQVRKWIDEKHQYYIVIDVIHFLNDNGTWSVRYPYKIKNHKLEIVSTDPGWETYDTSLEDAIDYVLDIILEQCNNKETNT